MTRAQLEHVIRAAADLAEDDEIVVIGSQAVLGQYPDAPAALLVSNEAHLYPRNRPERADLIDGSIGEGSPFHETFGYYAQGVGEETAVLPQCLEVHDLALSKYAAGRPKDRVFLRAAVKAGMLERPLLLERLASLPVTGAERERLRAVIDADFAA